MNSLTLSYTIKSACTSIWVHMYKGYTEFFFINIQLKIVISFYIKTKKGTKKKKRLSV